MKHLLNKQSFIALLCATLIVGTAKYIIDHSNPKTFTVMPSDGQEITITAGWHNITVFDSINNKLLYVGSDTNQAIQATLRDYCQGCGFGFRGQYLFVDDSIKAANEFIKQCNN